ncbi:MAG: ECF transporter S component [Helcococcus sp.]|nr:ECF transporter S component [Helcococcus sp.]
MKNTKDITLLGLMSAIIIVMLAIPGLGYIPLPFMNATLVHIPVIILAIVKGPKLGAVIGGVFGVSSLLNSLIRPNITSFIFINPLISVLPRILIGLFSGLMADGLRNKNWKYNLQNLIPAGIGSIVNTIGVLGMIYILYAKDYLEATGKVGQSAFAVIGYIAVTHGVVEMIIAMIIATPIANALLKYNKGKI